MTDQGHNFIREIAEAYRALEAEPGLQHQVRDFEARHIHDGDTIARLETRIMELKAQQDETLTKLRSVEAERDDAGFRQLEAEDKVANLVRAFQDVQTTVGHTTAAVTGSGKDITVMMSAAEKAELEAYKAEQAFKAERERLAEEARKAAEAKALEAERIRLAEEAAMPKPVEPQPEAVSEPIPFPTTETSVGQTIAQPTEQGQSESPPTVDGAQVTQKDEITGVGPVATASSEPIPGKYSGKRYHDWAYYVPLNSWLEGGGTEEDYNWRPAAIGSQR